MHYSGLLSYPAASQFKFACLNSLLRSRAGRYNRDLRKIRPITRNVSGQQGSAESFRLRADKEIRSHSSWRCRVFDSRETPARRTKGLDATSRNVPPRARLKSRNNRLRP